MSILHVSADYGVIGGKVKVGGGKEKNRNLDEVQGKEVRMMKWAGNIGRSGRIKQERKQMKLSTEEGTASKRVS